MENQLYINIALIGSVSTGKSTLLNALFLEQFSSMKIKRTTMVPQIYKETKGSNNLKSAKDINQQTSQINDKLIKESENGKNMTDNDCEKMSMTFYVKKIDYLQCLHKYIYFAIHDIPGLNDARTKQVYFNYVEKHFHIYDVIIFMIDIKSGLNTSDEIDILNMIIRNIINVKKKTGKRIKLLAIANKCDDMELISKKLQISEEMLDMYEQIKTTIDEKKQDIDVTLIPLCASDAFLYRMLKKDPNYELSTEHVNKIGVNNIGKRFNKIQPDKKRESIKHIITDDVFINDMIELSGFDGLLNSLKLYLNEQNQHDFVIYGIINDIDIIDKFTYDNFHHIINIYDSYFEKLENMSSIFDDNCNQIVHKKCLDILLKKLKTNIHDFIESYNVNTKEIKLLMKYINEIYKCIDICRLSKYTEEYILGHLLNLLNIIKISIGEYYSTSCIDISNITDILDCMINNNINVEYIEKIINKFNKRIDDIIISYNGGTVDIAPNIHHFINKINNYINIIKIEMLITLVESVIRLYITIDQKNNFHRIAVMTQYTNKYINMMNLYTYTITYMYINNNTVGKLIDSYKTQSTLDTGMFDLYIKLLNMKQ